MSSVDWRHDDEKFIIAMLPTEFVMSTAAQSLAAARSSDFPTWMRVVWAANLKLEPNGHSTWRKGELRRAIGLDASHGNNIGRIIQQAIEHGALRQGSWWGCIQPEHFGNGKAPTARVCQRCAAERRRRALSDPEPDTHDRRPNLSLTPAIGPEVATLDAESETQVPSSVWTSDSAAPPPRLRGVSAS